MCIHLVVYRRCDKNLQRTVCSFGLQSLPILVPKTENLSYLILDMFLLVSGSTYIARIVEFGDKAVFP